ncbi:MAG: efflux RND transporter periplasmic adaptor subunit [Thiotrichales bacterium]
MLQNRLPILFLMAMIAGSAFAATPVIVAEARVVNFDDRVEALGTLRANEMVALTANVTETVAAIRFDDGERVAAGDVLVELNSSEQRALLAEAKATVDEARAQFERVRPLAAQGTAAQSLLDERRREWDTARARLVAIESRLAERQIRAPFAGVVGLRNISVGALVRPGDLITTLDDDSVMKLEFSVPSTYLETLRPDLPISARARAFGAKTFEGVVSSIDSRVDPVTRSVVVRARVPNPDRALRPGMLMSVELRKAPRDAVVVPETALVPLGRGNFVFVVEAPGDRVARREVRIGSRRTGEVEIAHGVESGAKVVIHGTLRLRDGDLIEVRAVDDGERALRDMLSVDVVNTP